MDGMNTRKLLQGKIRLALQVLHRFLSIIKPHAPTLPSHTPGRNIHSFFVEQLPPEFVDCIAGSYWYRRRAAESVRNWQQLEFCKESSALYAVPKGAASRKEFREM